MSTVCHHSPTGAGAAHEIPKGGRRLDLAFSVDWGDDDVRDSHRKPLSFCSFGCLSAWAAERGTQHDGQVVSEGVAG